MFTNNLFLVIRVISVTWNHPDTSVNIGEGEI